jgi:hypothetical protein
LPGRRAARTRSWPGWPLRWSRCGSRPPITPGLHRFFQGATWLWAGIFLLLTVGLAVMMVTEPTKMFLLLSTAVTAALVVAGIGVSTLWFLSVLRRLGLRLRFAPA